MFLPCFPVSARFLLIVVILLGCWVPNLSVRAQNFLPQVPQQSSFDPPDDPTPPDTVGAGSRGMVSGSSRSIAW
jgi:hypothetical protein